MASFEDSQEAAFRRLIRQSIRKGPFSKGQRDVMIAFFNHWLHHRKSVKGVVHPGREKLARKAGVTVKTVSRTLGLLRATGVITAIAHLNGLDGKATEYTVSIQHLFALCEAKKSDLPVNAGTNVPGRGGDKMSRRINNVVQFPIQKREVS